MAILFFCTVFLVICSNAVTGWKFLGHNRFDIGPLRALREDAFIRLKEIKIEYEALIQDKDETITDIEEKISSLKTIIDCFKALDEIDKDLALFAEHLQGNDEKLKETAMTFTREFTECKEDIEEQLNSLL